MISAAPFRIADERILNLIDLILAGGVETLRDEYQMVYFPGRPPVRRSASPAPGWYDAIHRNVGAGARI